MSRHSHNSSIASNHLCEAIQNNINEMTEKNHWNAIKAQTNPTCDMYSTHKSNHMNGIRAKHRMYLIAPNPFDCLDSIQPHHTQKLVRIHWEYADSSSDSNTPNDNGMLWCNTWKLRKFKIPYSSASIHIFCLIHMVHGRFSIRSMYTYCVFSCCVVKKKWKPTQIRNKKRIFDTRYWFQLHIFSRACYIPHQMGKNEPNTNNNSKNKQTECAALVSNTPSDKWYNWYVKNWSFVSGTRWSKCEIFHSFWIERISQFVSVFCLVFKNRPKIHKIKQELKSTIVIGQLCQSPIPLINFE